MKTADGSLKNMLRNCDMASEFRKYFKGDAVIWTVIVALSIFSLLAVYSSTGSLAYKYQGGDTSYYVIKHAILLLFGLVIIFLTHKIHYKYFSRLSQVFLVIAVILLILTLIIGITINEATRWLVIPVIGLTFQTSDFAKLALIMYLARMLSLKQNNIKDYHGAFIPILVPVLIICMLILPANLSTAIILMATSFILMFIGRINFRYLFIFTIIVAAIFGIFVVIALSNEWEGRIGTWRNRIESFVDKDSDQTYQIDQSKIAIVSGGLIKVRPGKSVQRNFLPLPYSDFIYSIIIEEYGLAGGIIVMFLYLYLLFRAGVIIKKSTRTFPAFLAMGLTILIVIQAMVNMAVAVNILPVTGQPLPMISMGGTSMIFTCIEFGIILSVSREINKQAESTYEGAHTAKENIN
jgi:cell division protein FtsW